MRHIAATDPSLGRASAATMVKTWFLTSLSGALNPGSPEKARAFKRGIDAVAMLESGGLKLTEEERLLANDRYADAACVLHIGNESGFDASIFCRQ